MLYFIDKFIKSFSNTNDIIIFLQGDHGSNYFISTEGDVEQKLPAFFLIANKELLNKFPNSFYTLATNTNRLILKQDLRETMLSLAGITEKNRQSINLLTEVASYKRTCQDTLKGPQHCSCGKSLEMIKDPGKAEKFLFKQLQIYAEAEINSFSYSRQETFLERICKKITLDNITSIFHLQMNNVNEFYRLEISSNTRKNMKFMIDFFLSSEGKKMDIDRGSFRILNLNYLSYPIQARVITI